MYVSLAVNEKETLGENVLKRQNGAFCRVANTEKTSYSWPVADFSVQKAFRSDVGFFFAFRVNTLRHVGLVHKSQSVRSHTLL